MRIIGGRFRGTALAAVDAMNDPRAYMVGKRLIEGGKSPTPDLVSDPESDVKSLL
jgi:3-phenylpropionate/trans-cinnamate dioxygenase ferredoxin reductase component